MSDTALHPGDRLAQFEIVGLIGRGGMGEVYRARDTRLGREVALKTLPPGFDARSDRAARFEREARSASALNHPNIVAVHELGRDRDVSFIVSELVDGETLAHSINGRPMPLKRLLVIGEQIADGLAAAHAVGIVHRDLKPANVMIARDGRVKILDFGLARQDSGAAHAVADGTTVEISRPGVAVGTPGYMSPEQVRGELADARSDLFSLGVMLYEMVTGTRPFRGASSADVMTAILRDEPPAMPPASPPALDRIVRRCLDKEPARRFQSAADLAFALRSIDPGTGSGSFPAKPATRKRSRRWYWAAATIAVVGAAAALAYVWNPFAPPQMRPLEARLSRLTNDGALAIDAAISPDGKLFAYASDRADSSNLDIWVQQLDSSGRALGAVRLTDDAADDYDPDFAPDGSRIAFRSDREGGGIYAVSAGGGDAQLLVARGMQPRYSPDGRSLLYTLYTTAGPEIYVQGKPGAAPIQVGKGCAPSSAPVWSPDGSRVLFVGACGKDPNPRLWVSRLDGEPSVVAGGYFVVDQWVPNPARLIGRVSDVQSTYMVAVDIAADASRFRGSWSALTFGTQSEGRASAAADGRIVFSAEDQTTHIWAVPIDSEANATGQPVRITTRATRDYETYPVVSRDGSALLYLRRGPNQGGLVYRDLVTGRERELASDLLAQSPVFGPGHSRIMFAGFLMNAAERQLYETDVQGGAVRNVGEAGPFSPYLWDWSPDGHTVLWVGGEPAKILQWDATSRKERVLIEDTGSSVYQGHFSPDGRWVTFVSVGGDGSRNYIAPFRNDAAVPKPEWIAVTEGPRDDKPRFSPDGKSLIFSSDRDGFLCIWRRPLSADMHPVGAPAPVFHLHERRRSLKNLSAAEFQIDVGPKMIVFNQAERTGEIWLRNPVPKPPSK